jgi:hypothetical protein
VLKRSYNFLLFSNLYIVLCAATMCWHTAHFFCIDAQLGFDFYAFITSATLSSYSLHWYLSANENAVSERGRWTFQYQKILLFLLCISMVSCAYYGLLFWAHWRVLIPLAFLTFLYTAPKIPLAPFRILTKKAYAKTFYLAAIWTIVTVVLPVQCADSQYDTLFFCFLINRFLLLYPICLFFDFRDRNEDERSSILNIAQTFTKQQIGYLVLFFGILSLVSLCALWYQNVTFTNLFCLILPNIFLLATLRKSLNSQSDYWYYFVLDGLMMASGILLAMGKWLFLNS